MKIDIVIPTRKRFEQLNLLLTTIADAIVPNTTVWIFFDAWKELNQFKRGSKFSYSWLNLRVLQRPFTPPTFFNDFMYLSEADIVINLSDHCTVDKNWLKEICRAFRDKFPDYDGVIGAKVSDLPDNFLNSAFCAIGSKFADRFPNRAVWCSDYKVFYCDEELGLFAKSVGKFYFCPAATVTYYFPHFTAKIDDTWKWARRNKTHDVEMNKARHKANLLWGRDSGLLTNRREEIEPCVSDKGTTEAFEKVVG